MASHVHEKLDLPAFLLKEYAFINYGITAEVLDNALENCQGLSHHDCPGRARLKFAWWPIGCWTLYTKTVSGDKRESLEKEIRQTEAYIKRLENEISAMEQHRKDSILSGLFNDCIPNLLPAALQANIDRIQLADKLYRQNSRTKKTISKGAFLSVNDRRRYCEQEQEHAALLEQIEGFLSTMEIARNYRGRKTQPPARSMTISRK